MSKIIISCLITFCALFACSAENEASQKTKLANESTLTADEQTAVVAVIGSEKITLRDLERRLDAQPPLLREQQGNARRKMVFLGEWVRVHLLAREAIEAGLSEHPTVVEVRRNALVDSLVNEVGRNALRAIPISESSIREDVRTAGQDPEVLENLSAARQKRVRITKQTAVQDLLDSHKDARSIKYNDAVLRTLFPDESPKGEPSP